MFAIPSLSYIERSAWLGGEAAGSSSSSSCCSISSWFGKSFFIIFISTFAEEIEAWFLAVLANYFIATFSPVRRSWASQTIAAPPLEVKKLTFPIMKSFCSLSLSYHHRVASLSQAGAPESPVCWQRKDCLNSRFLKVKFQLTLSAWVLDQLSPFWGSDSIRFDSILSLRLELL